ncbi:MAG: leucine-rich repeat domain-containing protein, partial [Prevotella sp.]|nr:leucine-rich repeat domain-containing protein [Prevotella sp.]
FTSGAKMGTLFGNGFEDYTTNIELPTLSGRTMGNEQNVYNLQGQLMSKNNTSLDTLPEGIYIVNGKKYVVKK